MHLIHRQTVTITTPEKALALTAQDRIAEALANDTALEDMFDVVCQGHIIRLDRVEIDLGTFTGTFKPDDWLGVLIYQLETRLRQDSPAPHTTSKTPITTPHENVPPSFRGTDTKQATSPTYDTTDSAAALEMFLSTGRLPWWHDLTPTQDFVARFAAHLDPAQCASIAARVTAQPAALYRLTAHLNPAQIAAFLAPLLPQVPLSGLAMAEIGSTRAIEQYATTLRWRVAFWQPFFAAVSTSKPVMNIDSIVSEWIVALTDLDPNFVSTGQTNRRTVIQVLTAALPSQWCHAIKQARTATSIAVTNQPLNDVQRDIGRYVGKDDSTPETAPANTPTSRLRSRKTMPTDPDASHEKDDLFVTGAGVVLLHPFLPELFKELGLTQGGQFIDPTAQARAARVLGLLAFGAHDTLEPQLTLAKVMTGMAPDDLILPLPQDPEDIDAATALLDAVLSHWPALKTSSHEALRDAFLARDGRLCTVDEGWRLTVERRAQDVLLTNLPWGIGLIRLPWCTPLLHVNWID